MNTYWWQTAGNRMEPSDLLSVVLVCCSKEKSDGQRLNLDKGCLIDDRVANTEILFQFSKSDNQVFF